MEFDPNIQVDVDHARDDFPVSRSIDWYSEGQARLVEIEGVDVLVRLVGRKGRKARIAITAPMSAVFRDVDSR